MKLRIDRCKKCGATDEREEESDVNLFRGKFLLECGKCHAVGSEEEIADYGRYCPVCERRLPAWPDPHVARPFCEQEPTVHLDVSSNTASDRMFFGQNPIVVHARCVEGLGAVLVREQKKSLEAIESRGGIMGPFAEWCRARLRQLRGEQPR